MPPRRRTSPRSPQHRALGETIEELRKEAGLTQEGLSERSGLTFQRIGELERGVANPTFGMLIRVTEGLGMEMGDFAIRLAEMMRDELRQ